MKSKHSEWTQWDEAKSGRLLESSFGNIPSYFQLNKSSDVAKWSSRV